MYVKTAQQRTVGLGYSARVGPKSASWQR